jgi:hypothetical protein
MFKCFCWLFWSWEPNFLNIYWSTAMEEVLEEAKPMVIFGIEFFSPSGQCSPCFPCSERTFEGSDLYLREKQTRKSRFEKWSTFLCACWNQALLQAWRRRAHVHPPSLRIHSACCSSSSSSSFHIDLIQSTHFSYFFNSYLGTLKNHVSSLLSACTYLWANVQTS